MYGEPEIPRVYVFIIDGSMNEIINCEFLKSVTEDYCL